MITLERAKNIFSYDPLSGFIYRIKPNGDKAHQTVKDGKGYIIVHADGKNYKAHRIAWLLHTGSFPKVVIDHKNGIKDDNRICNLRDCSHSQNTANRLNQPKKSNLPKGTRVRNRPKKYMAYIYHQCKEHYLGSFLTKEESAKAYNDAALKFFGEFAALNELGIWG